MSAMIDSVRSGKMNIAHSTAPGTFDGRAGEFFVALQADNYRRTDHLFLVLMIVQWLAAIAVAWIISPRTWTGAESQTHLHIYAAVFLGGIVTIPPVLMALLRPGTVATRHAVAAGQLLMSALLIHLTGGRIETHFHVFGSLAILSFYHDWRVLITGGGIVAVDHAVRGIFWPQSVYGVLTASEWRFVEHAFWVAFEVSFLWYSCKRAEADKRKIAAQQTALEARREEAEELAQVKSDFLARMSHEIRTPMNGVIGMTDVLLGTPLSGSQREYAQAISSSGDVLLHLIDDILDFSKIEAGKLELESIAFDLAHVVQETTELFAPAAHAKGVQVACHIAPEIPAAVIGDPYRLRQVLSNLMSNAVKFTESGEVILRTWVHEDLGDRVCVSCEVSDTGIGLSNALQRRLFGAFMQADSATARKFGGTGLGLAISKQLVEKMSGKLEVESTPGEGATFRFTIVLEKQWQADEAVPVREDLEGLRVLIANREGTPARMLREQLERWKISISEAETGADALRKLSAAAAINEPFNFILVDNVLPDMSGEELLRRLQSEPALAMTKRILLAAFQQTALKETVDNLGLHTCLLKPVRPSCLFDALSVFDGSALGAGHSKEGSTPAHLLQGRRILLAEDNPVNQAVVRAMLTSLGYAVDIVDNGRAAVDAVHQRNGYALVLMDCQMPDVDGLEATAAIRALEEEAGAGLRVPIVALTANAMPQDRERCLKAGMDDHQAKPLKKDDLRRLLDKWIHRGAEGAGSGPPAPAEAVARSAGSIHTGSSTAIAARDGASIMAVLDELGQEVGEAAVDELVDLVLTTITPKIAYLLDAAAQRNAGVVEATAHAIRGTLAMLGADAAAKICEELEVQAKAGSMDDVPALAAELDDIYRRAESVVRTHRAATRHAA